MSVWNVINPSLLSNTLGITVKTEWLGWSFFVLYLIQTLEH